MLAKIDLQTPALQPLTPAGSNKILRPPLPALRRKAEPAGAYMVPTAAFHTSQAARPRPFRAAALLLALLLFLTPQLPAAYGASADGKQAESMAPEAEAEAKAAPADEAGAQAEATATPGPEANDAPAGEAAPETEGTAAPEPGKADAPAGEAEAGAAGEAKPAAKAAAAPTIRLFGTVEFRSLISNLPKWERVLMSEKSSPTFTGSGLDASNPQVAERWEQLKTKLKSEPLKEQAQRVNNFFNQWPYKIDLDLWGLEDYWATPREFINKSGDCEDYAIAKYYALRDLGVPASKLRVAAIKDTIRNLGHAVLIVYMENDAYVLDNLTNLVLSHKKLSHYAPQYSVNEEFLWRHVKPKAPAKK